VNGISNHTPKLGSLQKCPHWWETPALDIGIWEKWITSCFSTSSTKGVVLLLSSAYSEQDVSSLQGFHVSQLEKMSEDIAELSSTEWSHGRQIALSTTTNRVIDHRDHTMRHEMSWLYKLLWRMGEFPFQSSWLSILPLKFFIVSVPCFLLASLLSNLRTRFLLSVEGCNTSCYDFANHLLITFISSLTTHQILG
jgi:hypothetical protein